MKHLSRISLALLVGALTISATPAFAQNRGGRQPGGNGNNQRGNNNDRGGGGPRGGFGGGFGGFMEPAYNSRSVKKYGEMLGLTADQKTAVDALLDGYEQEARTAQEKMRTKMDEARQDARDSGDPGAWTKVQDQMKAFRDQRKKLDDGFVNDVKAVLTPAQLEKWPQVEIAQRRDTSMRRGFVSGERADVISIVDELKPSADVQKSLKPILDQYAQDLDRALVKRNDMQEKAFAKMGELRQSGDMEAAQKVIEEGRQASVAVRDINRNFAKQVAAALPDDQKAAFNDAFKKASFPDVYRTTNTTSALKAAGELKDLTADQKTQIATIQATYDKNLSSVNDKLAKATEDMEMNFNIGNMFGGRGGGGRNGGQDNPAGELRTQKRDLDRSTLDSLKKVLSEDQQNRLPKPDDNGRGGPGGRGRNGGGRNAPANQDI